MGTEKLADENNDSNNDPMRFESDRDDEEEEFAKLKEKMKHPVLREFADYLYANKLYKIEELEYLLLKEWDGIFPIPMVSDDAAAGQQNFLYRMGDFVVRKTIGSRFPEVGGIKLRVLIIPVVSYDFSFVYILERETRSFMAAIGGHKIYNRNPDTIANNLISLEKQVADGWELVNSRVSTFKRVGTPTDLLFGKQEGNNLNAEKPADENNDNNLTGFEDAIYYREKDLAKLKKKMKHPILREFADYLWLNHTPEQIKALLLKEWDDYYPKAALGFGNKTPIAGLKEFLWNMGEFVVRRVVGKDFVQIGGCQLYISVVPDTRRDEALHIYVVEGTTRSLLAQGCGNDTRDYDPDTIADDLLSLERQVKEGWELVRRRVLALDLLGTPTDLPFRKGQE